MNNIYMTDKYFKCAAKNISRPAWLCLYENRILPMMISKFSTEFSDKDNVLMINFSKKNLNYIKGIKSNIICIALSESEYELKRIKFIWNIKNELFDEAFTKKEFYSWLENNNMKFDKIIMNPPYYKNLH